MMAAAAVMLTAAQRVEAQSCSVVPWIEHNFDLPADCCGDHYVSGCTTCAWGVHSSTHTPMHSRIVFQSLQAQPSTIYRVRHQLDCVGSSAYPCQDAGAVVSYGGDATITSDCPTTWSTNVPAGGSAVNAIVFTANPPLQLPANSGEFCSLWWNDAQVGGPPGLWYLHSANFGAVQQDAVCGNGKASGANDANQIWTCPLTCGCICVGAECAP